MDFYCECDHCLKHWGERDAFRQRITDLEMQLATQSERVNAAEYARAEWEKNWAESRAENSRLRTIVDKLHGLVDSALVEPRYWGPRNDTRDGKTVAMLIDDFKKKADAAASDAESRQDSGLPKTIDEVRAGVTKRSEPDSELSRAIDKTKSTSRATSQERGIYQQWSDQEKAKESK